MNGDSRLENLIRGGNQQSVDQEQNGQAVEVAKYYESSKSKSTDWTRDCLGGKKQ